MSVTPPLSDNRRYEQACDQAIAMCDGNLRSTIKALIMANEYLEIELSVPFPTGTRLDRLLASELGIARSRLSGLRERALLWADPDRADLLRRRIRSGLRITVWLPELADPELAWKPSVGGGTTDR